jgi:putative tryptophan/tyrosine transport system substrate-binding protein
MDSDRRKFITLVGTAFAGWPVLAHAQTSRRVPTVGVLMGLANDEESKRRIEAFEKGLASKGWVVGKNLKIDRRYTAGDPKLMNKFAVELVALRADVIVAHSTPVVSAVLKVTRTVPVVFVVVSDPIGSGFVASMARPGGNVTGFTNLAATMSGKYLSILRELVPNLAHVAIIYNPDSATNAGEYYLPPFIESAKEFKVTAVSIEVRSAAEITKQMENLSSTLGAGLIVMPDNFMTLNRGLVVSLAARLRIPAMYPYRYFVDEGGLLSYGVDVLDLFSRASDYVDRILKGAKPAVLPVQAPRKFELVINLKTARALNLSVPQILLAGADALVE